MKHTRTLKVRIKDRHRPLLQQMARSVNFVWNYVNELSHRSIRERGMFLSAYDIYPYTKGAGKDLGLHSQTLQEVSREYVTRRQQFRPGCNGASAAAYAARWAGFRSKLRGEMETGPGASSSRSGTATGWPGTGFVPAASPKTHAAACSDGTRLDVNIVELEACPKGGKHNHQSTLGGCFQVHRSCSEGKINGYLVGKKIKDMHRE